MAKNKREACVSLQLHGICPPKEVPLLLLWHQSHQTEHAGKVGPHPSELLNTSSLGTSPTGPSSPHQHMACLSLEAFWAPSCQHTRGGPWNSAHSGHRFLEDFTLGLSEAETQKPTLIPQLCPVLKVAGFCIPSVLLNLAYLLLWSFTIVHVLTLGLFVNRCTGLESSLPWRSRLVLSSCWFIL